MHAVLADLERAGLVTRERDAADRRRNVVAVTAAAAPALERLDARVAAAQEELLGALDGAEREQLLNALARLVAGGDRAAGAAGRG
jgi:DNA-binding MarR family transcriptional regulator